MSVLNLAGEVGLPLADYIAAGARETALAILSGGTDIEVVVYDRHGLKIGHAK